MSVAYWECSRDPGGDGSGGIVEAEEEQQLAEEEEGRAVITSLFDAGPGAGHLAVVAAHDEIEAGDESDEVQHRQQLDDVPELNNTRIVSRSTLKHVNNALIERVASRRISHVYE